ncbi:MAG TPA: alkaline phosphatase family protein [Polyangiaceae bacterium]|nr:alkaline phosphatase family protein [Polyangiaceae bacterium]
MSVSKIVVLMLENRSFDHMLGLRPGVIGLLAPDGSIDPKHANPIDPSKPGSKKYQVTADAPYAVDPEDVYKDGTTTYGGPSHSFPSTTEQLTGSTTGAVGRDAPHSGFVKSYYDVLVHSAHRANPSDAEIRLPMQAFGRDRLPVLWTLADEFVVCDSWFSAMPGPTQPNRLFVHAATSAGFAHNVWSHPIEADTIYDRLDEKNKTWGMFYHDMKDSDSFPQLKKRTDRILPFASFLALASDGRLPQYTFVCPRYNDAPEGRANSQHAPEDVRDGENLIADVYESLRKSPDWGTTLLVVTYDEHGGFYDHVTPPAAAAPDDSVSPTAFDRQEAARSSRNQYLLAPDYQFRFDRLGLRVPAILVSPLVGRGTVDSTPYDHTSILATVRDVFGTRPLTKRDAASKSFAGQLGGPARKDCPEKLPRPTLSEAEKNEVAMQSDLARPPSAPQREMWPALAHLDGHPDSGKVTAPPATRGQAAQYIKERVDAHNDKHRRRQ